MEAWQIFRKEFEETQSFFLLLIKKPVEGIRSLPNWRWPTLIITHALFSAVSGIIAGLVDASFVRVLLGILVFPIASSAVAAVSTFFLMYSAQLFFHKNIEPKSLATLVVVAAIPFQLFHVISPLLPPVDLIGFALTAILIIVGMVDNFHTPKSGTIRLLFMMWGVFFLMWSFEKFQEHRSRERAKNFAPKSFEEMVREEQTNDRP